MFKAVLHPVLSSTIFVMVTITFPVLVKRAAGIVNVPLPPAIDNVAVLPVDTGLDKS